MNMSRCIIITSYQSMPIREFFDLRQDDFVICADGGYACAKAENIRPRMVIGDFDSTDHGLMEKDLERSGWNDCRIVRVAAEKDDTDTMLCLKYGIDQGFHQFFALGGLGGRLDHTVANLQTAAYAADRGKSIWFLDGNNRATVRKPGKLTVPRADGFKLSLFSFGDRCEGVSIRGVKYPLDNHTMTNRLPLGVSNEFCGDAAEISHTAGNLLIILSRD